MIRLMVFVVTAGLVFVWGCCPVMTTIRAITGESKSEAKVDPGKAIYEETCGACHEPIAPSEQPAAKWEKAVGRFAAKGKITEEEKVLILDYLLSNL
jgi:cytochrome c5